MRVRVPSVCPSRAVAQLGELISDTSLRQPFSFSFARESNHACATSVLRHYEIRRRVIGRRAKTICTFKFTFIKRNESWKPQPTPTSQRTWQHASPEKTSSQETTSPL